jgi:signal transduction histidine kinase
MLQKITLPDQVTSDAAGAERQRIVLDVHDGIAPPAIGLQLGLRAVGYKLQRGSTDRTHDADCLLQLTPDERVQLRHRGQDLKRGEAGFDGLAAEVFHLVAEALSNIRRYIRATTARISLVQENEYLPGEIRHDGVEREDRKLFTARAIIERTMALGGEVCIERQGSAQTVVIVEISIVGAAYAGRSAILSGFSRRAFNGTISEPVPVVGRRQVHQCADHR